MLLFSCALMNAQDPEFVASVSSARVAQNTVFDVRFELREAKGQQFKPPSFQGFSIIGGPSIGSSTMIINGEVSSSQSWSYSLLASKQGRFVIEPAYVVAGRQKLTTKPITIEVVQPKEIAKGSASASGKEQIILIAETDTTRYFPGQQIILNYRLLFREDIHSVNEVGEDDYTGFFVQPFTTFSHEAMVETIHGVPYTSRIVKSMALFAHQSGTYTIDPMVMNVGVNAPFSGNQGLFSFQRIMEVQVASAPLTITVVPLPGDDAANFSGAVGQYSIDIITANNNITTDDAFTFELKITGNGDARRWDLPEPVLPDTFELFEPKIKEDKLADHEGQFQHVRTILYQAVPNAAGNYEIYVPFTYFDPKQASYKTINSDTLRLQVRQGSGKYSGLSSSGNTTDKAFGLMNVGRIWLKDQFWMSIPHLVLFAFILTGSGFGVVTAMRKRKESQIPEKEKLRMQARQLALDQLDQLSKNMQSSSLRLNSEKATEIFHRYLIHHFSIDSGDLDDMHLRQHLAGSGLDTGTIERIATLFQTSLSFRYGAGPSPSYLEQFISECRALINGLN